MKEFVVYEVRVVKYGYVVEAEDEEHTRDIIDRAIWTGEADEYRAPELDRIEETYYEIEER